MSDTGDAENGLEEVAAAFGRSMDPLEAFEETFAGVDTDPFGLFIDQVLIPKGRAHSTIRQYRRVFEEWREHMVGEGRHPACPNEGHVKSFIHWQLTDETDPRPNGRPNAPSTVKDKLWKLDKCYQFWQEQAAFPHPQDYNPFQVALETVNLEGPDAEKEQWPISEEELRDRLAAVTHWRKLAVIVTQLKLGIRAGEVANIRLEDFSIRKTEVARHFDEMGSNRMLDGRENAIYIPPRHERDGNKSRRPRVLPLDDELQRVLLRYLLVRPDNGEPWLFLSKKSHSQLTPKRINQIWKDEFHPEYAETDRYRPLTSHYGRHRFTTYWTVEQDVNRELVKYMRGDKAGGGRLEDRATMDEYLHTYYQDIESLYRDRMYRLDL